MPRSAALARQAARLVDPGETETLEKLLPDSFVSPDSGNHAPPPQDEDSKRAAANLPNFQGEDSHFTFEEFRELVTSAGAEIAGEVFQRRPRPDPATLVGQGKVREIAAAAESTASSVILFDHNLSPTQLRNLEDALPVRAVDRTQLILDIFARHARTREGQLQVELAQLEYMLPRLSGRGSAMSQLGGGIGTRGPGETQLETDRRRIQRRLLQLRAQLEAVRRVRKQQRQRREAVPVPTIALVGYTNAGKSTLFNTLTRAEVLASSRMFATLDPKLRAMVLPSRRKILLSDTVGFIRDLPHTLITSFRATLEEVEKAEVLLHVQDCSSPVRGRQAEEVEKVLGELGVLSKPRIAVWNKIDLLPAWKPIAADRYEFSLGGRFSPLRRRHLSITRANGPSSHRRPYCGTEIRSAPAGESRAGRIGCGRCYQGEGISRRCCSSGGCRACLPFGAVPRVPCRPVDSSAEKPGPPYQVELETGRMRRSSVKSYATGPSDPEPGPDDILQSTLLNRAVNRNSSHGRERELKGD